MMDLACEEVGAEVDRAVEELLHAAGCAGPPVDALALAREHLGMAVCLDRRQRQRGRAQRSEGAAQIFLRPEPSLERRQWTVAHEIGEHRKLLLLARLAVGPEGLGRMTGEALADLFAARLLVPQCWFADDARRLDFELPRLKERYATASHEVLAWRLLDLPDPCTITIFDQGRVTRRRSNAGLLPTTLSPAERECQQHVHQHGQQHWVGDVVRGWPVHQAEWKREILRTVLAEE